MLAVRVLVWLGLESWFVLDPWALGGGGGGGQGGLPKKIIFSPDHAKYKNSLAQYLYLGPSNSTIFRVLGP